MTKRTLTFILNPISGTHSKSDIPNLIDGIIDKERFDWQIRTTEYAGHAAEIARECVKQHTSFYYRLQSYIIFVNSSIFF